MKGDGSPAGRFRAACGRKLSSRASLGGGRRGWALPWTEGRAAPNTLSADLCRAHLEECCMVMVRI